MTPCDRCGGTEGKIDRGAHVAPDQCIRALQRQMAKTLGIINGLREERDEARELVERVCDAVPIVDADLIGDMQTAIASWKGGAT